MPRSCDRQEKFAAGHGAHAAGGLVQKSAARSGRHPPMAQKVRPPDFLTIDECQGILIHIACDQDGQHGRRKTP